MLLTVWASILIVFLAFLFFFSAKKSDWSGSAKTIFECGFSSYFFSRFSFPIHYFIVALTFLLLDLELTLLFPFFMEMTENFSGLNFLYLFALSLTLGLLIEWSLGLLEWKF